jgi:hypothetical protein
MMRRRIYTHVASSLLALSGLAVATDSRAIDALEHPLQHATIFTESRPQETTVFVAAEPVDEEDFRKF